jgi:hypothetical protein
MQLCLQDLAELTGGQLRLARMPPRDGELARIHRLVLREDGCSEGSVYWCFDRRQCAAELSYLRGALGVVSSQFIEPWPGRFSLLVADPLRALERVVAALSRGEALEDIQPPSACPHSKHETSSHLPELKVLQLCAGGGVDIYSPTCGRPADELALRSCQRRAA